MRIAFKELLKSHRNNIIETTIKICIRIIKTHFTSINKKKNNNNNHYQEHACGVYIFVVKSAVGSVIYFISKKITKKSTDQDGGDYSDPSAHILTDTQYLIPHT